MPCPVCGATNAPTSLYCSQCGYAFGVLAPTLALPTGRLVQNALLAGRYRITRKIADGGFSAVYLAEDTRLGQHIVAVKEMVVGTGGTNPQAIQQALTDFQREAEMLAHITHPNLPRVIDRFEEQGRHFLVMDYVEGQTLRQVAAAAGGPLPEALMLGWAQQLCSVLEFLHSRQPPIIYRDLKPENVMLQGDGTLKLIDFGIARLYRHGGTSDTVPLGTPGYAAPEQYGSGQSDARADVYALGATLYELLTGYDISRSPFQLAPARQHNPALSPRTELALQQAMQPHPAHRFQTVAAFARALDPQPRSGPPSKRRGWLRPVIGAAGLGLLVGGGWAMWNVVQGRQQNQSSTTVIAAQPATPVATSQATPSTSASVLLALVTTPTVTVVPTDKPAPTISPAPTSVPTLVPPSSTLTLLPSPTLVPTVVPPSPTPVPPTPGPALPIKVSGVQASSLAPAAPDACGQTNSYEPQNVIDGRPNTAWRVQGDGNGAWIDLDLGTGVKVTRVGLIVGYDKIDACDGTDRFFQGRIVRQVRLEFDNGQHYASAFAAQRQVQYVELPDVPTQHVHVVILQSDPPPANNGRDLVAISEIEVWGRP
ncbi:MAG: protein kinase [Herpetosiphonaceae bacterium]|nr:protein kinase [Herpetosiphonaceae bacterium]